jgi:hypothetical protein
MHRRGRVAGGDPALLLRLLAGDDVVKGGRSTTVTPSPIFAGGPQPFIGGGASPLHGVPGDSGSGSSPRQARPDCRTPTSHQPRTRVTAEAEENNDAARAAPLSASAQGGGSRHER